jgi:hypothetical protein
VSLRSFMGGRRARRPPVGGGVWREGKRRGEILILSAPQRSPCFLSVEPRLVSLSLFMDQRWLEHLGFLGNFRSGNVFPHDNRFYTLWYIGTFGISPTKRSLF